MVISEKQVVTARHFVGLFAFTFILGQIGRQPQYLADVINRR